MSGKTQQEREETEKPEDMTDKQIKEKLDELLGTYNNPLDHIELSINAKNQTTGKVKIHYDGHDSRNKFTAFSEAMEIIHKIKRINDPPQTMTRTKPMHLTDEKMDYE